MEQAQLQLVVNVIAITGVSSLASFWYLLRRDRKLAAKPSVESNRQERDNPALPQPMSPVTSKTTATEQDIRHLAADRRTGWVKGLTSAISHDGCC
jgi:exonuclease VII large subunit